MGGRRSHERSKVFLELVEGENLSIEPNLIGANHSAANLAQGDLSRAELSELDRGYAELLRTPSGRNRGPSDEKG